MIFRGESHVLRSDTKLLKKAKSPLTLTVLKQLQELYEVRARRKIAEDDGYDPICIKSLTQFEFEEYCHLIDLLDDWMQPPTIITFEKKRKNRV